MPLPRPLLLNPALWGSMDWFLACSWEALTMMHLVSRGGKWFKHIVIVGVLVPGYVTCCWCWDS
jgi:hypothetical protein